MDIPQLEKFHREIESINERAGALCSSLSEEQMRWREAPGRWSTAENLHHLILTTEQVLPAVDESIERARQRDLLSEGPFRLGWMGRLLVWYVEPPPLIRLPAPKTLQPELEGRATDLLGRFQTCQQQMLRRLESAQGIDLKRARFASPFARFISMSLLTLFCVFTAHQRRHLWQIANLQGQWREQGMGPPTMNL